MASFEKRETGWTVRFRITTPSGERQKRLSGYKTKAEANKAMVEYLEEHKSEDKDFDGVETFGDLCALWLENVRARSKESTYLAQKNRIEKHILPVFGKRKVSDIAPVDILNWQNCVVIKLLH